MPLKNKIIAGVTGLALAGGTAIVTLDQFCVFDDETLKVGKEKICFETKKDYDTFKKNRIKRFRDEGALFIYTAEGEEFVAMVNKELENRKDVKAKVNKSNNLLEAIVNEIDNP